MVSLTTLSDNKFRGLNGKMEKKFLLCKYRLDKGRDRLKRCLIKSFHLERSVRQFPFLLLLCKYTHQVTSPVISCLLLKCSIIPCPTNEQFRPVSGLVIESQQICWLSSCDQVTDAFLPHIRPVLSGLMVQCVLRAIEWPYCPLSCSGVTQKQLMQTVTVCHYPENVNEVAYCFGGY